MWELDEIEATLASIESGLDDMTIMEAVLAMLNAAISGIAYTITTP
jgi:hypothetical protein